MMPICLCVSFRRELFKRRLYIQARLRSEQLLLLYGRSLTYILYYIYAAAAAV